MTWTIYPEEQQAIRDQIGMNILAISGGVWNRIADGIEMPCGAGYTVRVQLTPGDDYTVTRVFKRAGEEFIHGSRKGVFCDEVSEVAYFASCFRSYSELEWPSK